MDINLDSVRFHCVTPEVFLHSDVVEISSQHRREIASKVCSELLKTSGVFATDYLDFVFNSKSRSEFKTSAGFIRIYSPKDIYYSDESGKFINLGV